MKQCDRLAYLAGLIDGEGCATIVRVEHPSKKYPPRIEHKARLLVVNTDKKMIEWCVKHFGGFLHQRRFRQTNWKDCYSWHRGIAKKDRAWLVSLIPYLITKKDRVKLLVDYIDLIGHPRFKTAPEVIEKREAIRQEIKRLNA